MFLLTACAKFSQHKKATKLSLAVLPFAVFQLCPTIVLIHILPFVAETFKQC